MKQHIEQFAKYLQEGYIIWNQIDLWNIWEYNKIILVWMWWSAMALTVIKWLVSYGDNSLPIEVVTQYKVPNWVDSSTLMICASYSGNTEETVSAMQDALDKWAQMIALTSGWILAEFCQTWWQIYAQMPTWIEPRAALPYSFWIQLALFERLWHIEWVKWDLDWFSSRSNTHTQKVELQAKKITDYLYDRLPFVYTTSGYEAVALRAEQQLQENSRMLAHHHIIPEHNHNELLWRQEWSDIVDVLWLTDPDAFPRNEKRVQLTKKVLDDRNIRQTEIILQWSSILTKIISWIYQVDWLSYYIAIKRWIDPSWMKIIEDLKAEMKTFKNI